jgi:hypothetical protein
VERKKRDGEVAAAAAKKPPGKKRKTGKRKAQALDFGEDIWDAALYGDADTNEALAAEIFDFSEKEFKRVTAKYKGMSSSVADSETASSTGQPAASSKVAAQVCC